MKKLFSFWMMLIASVVLCSCDDTDSEVVIKIDEVVLGKYTTIQNIIVSDGAGKMLPIKTIYPLGTVEVTPNTTHSVWVNGGLRITDLHMVSRENEPNYGVAFTVPPQLSWGYTLAGINQVELPDNEMSHGFYAISSKVMSLYYTSSITEYYGELKKLLDNYTEAEWKTLLGYMAAGGVTKETALYAISSQFQFVIVQQFMKKI